MNDLISRQAAIDALWKALYEYEDKTEKQFQESEDLDIRDWCVHRIFVQNMNDIDRQTLLDLPSAGRRGRWKFNIDDKGWSWDEPYVCDQCGKWNGIETPYCPNCGADMMGE